MVSCIQTTSNGRTTSTKYIHPNCFRGDKQEPNNQHRLNRTEMNVLLWLFDLNQKSPSHITLHKTCVGFLICAVLTSNDVAIAILVAVLLLFGGFPGCCLSLCESLNTHTRARVNSFELKYKHIEICMHIWPDAQSLYSDTWASRS